MAALSGVAIRNLLFQQFTHRIDLTQIGKGKILVVQYHPFGTLFQRKVLNLRKETKRHNDLATVRQESCHFSTERREIQLLYPYCYIVHLAHKQLLSNLTFYYSRLFQVKIHQARGYFIIIRNIVISTFFRFIPMKKTEIVTFIET